MRFTKKKLKITKQLTLIEKQNLRRFLLLELIKEKKEKKEEKDGYKRVYDKETS